MAKKLTLVIEVEFAEDVSEDLYDDRAEWVRSRIGDCAKILEVHVGPWYPEGPDDLEATAHQAVTGLQKEVWERLQKRDDLEIPPQHLCPSCSIHQSNPDYCTCLGTE